jgi:hypothetical protein
MNPEILLALVATTLTGGVGALFSVFGLVADFLGQRALSSLMANPDHADDLQILRTGRDALAGNPPNTMILQSSRKIVNALAANLPKWQRKAVVKTLEERSDADSAEYIVRLIDAAVRRLGDTGSQALTA